MGEDLGPGRAVRERGSSTMRSYMNRRPHCHGTESTTTSSTRVGAAQMAAAQVDPAGVVERDALHRASGSTATSPQANNERWPGTTTDDSILRRPNTRSNRLPSLAPVTGRFVR